MYKPLREVRIHYSNGYINETNVSGNLTNREIKEYFKRGKVFNIGNGEHDRLTRVRRVEILR